MRKTLTILLCLLIFNGTAEAVLTETFKYDELPKVTNLSHVPEQTN